MTSRVPLAALALAVALAPTLAAACSTAGTGARCVRVASAPAPSLAAVPVAAARVATPPAPAVGDVLDRGRHSILMNAEYYGLPPVSDGWVYMRVGPDLFRVDWRSHRVIERVTDRAAANF